MLSWTKILSGGERPSSFSAAGRGGSAPAVVVWNVTAACNLSCRHCYAAAVSSSSSEELSTQEAEAAIDDMADFGVRALLFSGGEPLLRGDIFSLASRAGRRGMRPALSTNATLLTQDAAAKIQDAGFVYVGISLDGAEATHDAFRKQPDAFRQALCGLEQCRSRGLQAGIRFTLLRHNQDELPEVLRLAQEAAAARFCIYHLVPAGRARALAADDLSHSERRQTLEWIFQKAQEAVRRGSATEILTVDNHADAVWLFLRLRQEDPGLAEKAYQALAAQGGNASGKALGCIDAAGNIYADQFLRTRALGNVRSRPFSSAWQDESNPLLAGLRNRAQFLKGRCPQCRFLSLCNGNFRARAEAATGDLWAEDPSCYLTDAEIGLTVTMSQGHHVTR